MQIPSNLLDFWNAFTTAHPGADESRFYEAFFFGDGEALADELAALVLQGTKRATTGSVWSFEAEGRCIPEPGDLSIVTTWAGKPLCVIQTRSVEIVPFNAVTASFAAAEGEGDGSLAFWMQGHRRYFERECARAGREFTEDMLVACEHFDVVYQPSSDDAALS
jgi:uncharacterized protein YhfF